MRRRPLRFDLIAGKVCLDFVNTLDDRYTKPKELLETYIDLVRFGEVTGVLDSRQVDRLFERGQADPDRAQKVLGWARELREAIHDVFRALMDKSPVPPAPLARLNAYIQGAMVHLRLVAVKSGFEWTFGDFGELDSVLWPIARSAAELLARPSLVVGEVLAAAAEAPPHRRSRRSPTYPSWPSPPPVGASGPSPT